MINEFVDQLMKPAFESSTARARTDRRRGARRRHPFRPRAGAALDVFRKEPLKDSAYFGLDNVLLSPHVAGSTDEAQEAIASSSQSRCETTSSSASCSAPSICPRSPTRSTSRSRPTSTWRSASDSSSPTPLREIWRVSRSHCGTARPGQDRTHPQRRPLRHPRQHEGDSETGTNANRINARGPGRRARIRIQERRRRRPRRRGKHPEAGAALLRRRCQRIGNRAARQLAAPALLRRHRHRSCAARDPAGLPQPRRPRGHRRIGTILGNIR